MISMPDNPEDVKDVIQKVIRSLLKMDKGPADQPSDVPVIIGYGKLASQTTSGIAALHFKNLNMMKLLKAFLAARVIYGVHQLDVVACHRMATDSGVGLVLAISALAAVPTAPFIMTKTRGMVPSEVAKVSVLLAGTVCPGLLTHGTVKFGFYSLHLITEFVDV
ncbi:uncharacterized protein LOC112873523 [Panicum hallii]|uniref:uncharacterized protein LOC112873523 n=1 Tax=Panicum hallii TaxID=206008 RepID=UPI000DF4DA19|nr:uncharacterized protein LOC112873523 [Panicum hallii]